MNPLPSTPSCPLCQGPASQPVDQLSRPELESLWRVVGHCFTEDAWGAIAKDSLVVRRRCDACGYQFFDPALAGNEAFYRQLEHAEYFAPDRPEFVRSLDMACRRGLRRVMDVGCGSGLFLDLARQAGLETFGLELNPAAAEKARAKGHQVLDRMLHELRPDQALGSLDLITFFQVLEHVPDPVAVLRQAADLLKPGGVISAAGPSAEGFYRLTPWDPHQWPPHHVSLWRLADFAQLGRASGLRLIESGGDRLYGTDIERGGKLHNRLAASIGRPRRPGGEWLPQLAGMVYRKSGMKLIFPHWGVSIYAYFEKP